MSLNESRYETKGDERNEMIVFIGCVGLPATENVALDVVLRPLAPVGAAPKRRRQNLAKPLSRAQSCNTIEESCLCLLDRNIRQGKYQK